MKKGFPTRQEAEEILMEAVEYRRKEIAYNPLSLYVEEQFITHSQDVAMIAEKLASRTAYLNPEKAYVLGLLHDYGKRIDEKLKNSERVRFHGLEGYEEMQTKGFFGVAQVCLSHTFPEKNFNIRNFWYPKNLEKIIREELAKIEYDDYDRLIQLADKLTEKGKIVSIETRSYEIQKRYKLSDIDRGVLIKEGLELKEYFDKICGENIYKILGIIDEDSKL